MKATLRKEDNYEFFLSPDVLWSMIMSSGQISSEVAAELVELGASAEEVEHATICEEPRRTSLPTCPANAAIRELEGVTVLPRFAVQCRAKGMGYGFTDLKAAATSTPGQPYASVGWTKATLKDVYSDSLTHIAE